MEFPRYVFKQDGNDVIVNDDAEYAAAIKAGWYHSKDFPAEPVVIEAKELADELPPTRDELEAKATELGLKFDGRTTDAKLLKLISEAI